MKKQPSQDDQGTSTNLQTRYPEGYWDNAADYLDLCYPLQHNEDYLEFLVSRVWRLDQVCRIVDFGCGFGNIGLKLMPLLAQGSTYTGIDENANLIDRGRQVWAQTSWPAEFFEGDVHQTPFDDSTFDIAITHTVLMHVPYPEKVLQEMIRVTKPNGLVITCEANRNAHTALLHIEEVNRQETVPLELFQTINRDIRKRTGVDHNIGMKMPVLMHKAGLKHIQIRLEDAVRFLYPPIDTEYKKRIYDAICSQGYAQKQRNAEERAQWKANLMAYGITALEAEAEITRELAEDFLTKGDQFHTVYASLLTWSFGTVEK